MRSLIIAVSVLLFVTTSYCDEVVDVIVDDPKPVTNSIPYQYTVADEILVRLATAINGGLDTIGILKELNDPFYHTRGMSLFILDIDEQLVVYDQLMCTRVLTPLATTDIVSYATQGSVDNNTFFVTRMVMDKYIIGMRFTLD